MLLSKGITRSEGSDLDAFSALDIFMVLILDLNIGVTEITLSWKVKLRIRSNQLYRIPQVSIQFNFLVNLSLRFRIYCPHSEY